MKWETYLVPAAFVVFIISCLWLYKTGQWLKEPFGFSDGTIIQLQTSHVPTVEDEENLKMYRKQVEHDLIDMTGSA